MRLLPPERKGTLDEAGTLTAAEWRDGVPARQAEALQDQQRLLPVDEPVRVRRGNKTGAESDLRAAFFFWAVNFQDQSGLIGMFSKAEKNSSGVNRLPIFSYAWGDMMLNLLRGA